MYRVAVIDDEYMVIEGMKVIVKRCGCDCEVVASAENGRDALPMLRAVKPDIVFADIRMPGMDGLSMMEQAMRELPETDFVVISGYAEFSYARKALVLGVRDYIEKPVTVEKVRNILTKLTAERGQQAEAPAAGPPEAEGEALHRGVRLCLRYMEEHYGEDIGLNDMAEQAGVTPAYLSSLFKEEMGTSPVKYLTKVRIDKAKELLRAGHKVADVSVLVGYPDYRYFCEVFKKQEGRTPNEYRGGTRKK